MTPKRHLDKGKRYSDEEVFAYPLSQVIVSENGVLLSDSAYSIFRLTFNSTSERPVGNRSEGVPVLPPLSEASVGGGWIVRRVYSWRR